MPLSTKSCFEKIIKLDGASLTVQIMLHKALKLKEMEQVSVKTKVLGPILKPYLPFTIAAS